MTLEERMARARDALDTTFDRMEAPAARSVRALHLRRRRAKWTSVAMLGLVAIAGSAFVLREDEHKLDVSRKSTTTTAERPRETTIRIRIGNAGFDPARIETSTGAHRLMLESLEGEHRLVFDDPLVTFVEPNTIGLVVTDAGATDTKEVFFPEAGEYRFFDALPNGSSLAQGVFVVSGPSQTAPATSTTTATSLATTVPTSSSTAAGASMPSSAYAVREDGALVELDSTTGQVRRVIAKLDDPRTGGPDNPAPMSISSVRVAGDGTVYYETCCEPAVGSIHRAPHDWDANVTGTALSVNWDGARLAVSTGDTGVAILDATTGAELHRIATDKAVHRTSWSPDGTRLAIGYTDGNVVVTDVDASSASNATVVQGTTDQEIQTEFALPTFLPDGRLALSDGFFVPAGGKWSDFAYGDNSPYASIAVWDGSERMEGVSFAHGYGISDLAVDPSGTHLLVVGNDMKLRSAEIPRTATGRWPTWTVLGAGYVAADW